MTGVCMQVSVLIGWSAIRDDEVHGGWVKAGVDSPVQLLGAPESSRTPKWSIISSCAHSRNGPDSRLPGPSSPAICKKMTWRINLEGGPLFMTWQFHWPLQGQWNSFQSNEISILVFNSYITTLFRRFNALMGHWRGI